MKIERLDTSRSMEDYGEQRRVGDIYQMLIFLVIQRRVELVSSQVRVVIKWLKGALELLILLPYDHETNRLPELNERQRVESLASSRLANDDQSLIGDHHEVTVERGWTGRLKVGVVEVPEGLLERPETGRRLREHGCPEVLDLEGLLECVPPIHTVHVDLLSVVTL